MSHEPDKQELQIVNVHQQHNKNIIKQETTNCNSNSSLHDRGFNQFPFIMCSYSGLLTHGKGRWIHGDGEWLGDRVGKNDDEINHRNGEKSQSGLEIKDQGSGVSLVHE